MEAPPGEAVAIGAFQEEGFLAAGTGEEPQAEEQVKYHQRNSHDSRGQPEGMGGVVVREIGRDAEAVGDGQD